MHLYYFSAVFFQFLFPNYIMNRHHALVLGFETRKATSYLSRHRAMVKCRHNYLFIISLSNYSQSYLTYHCCCTKHGLRNHSYLLHQVQYPYAACVRMQSTHVYSLVCSNAMLTNTSLPNRVINGIRKKFEESIDTCVPFQHCFFQFLSKYISTSICTYVVVCSSKPFEHTFYYLA